MKQEKTLADVLKEFSVFMDNLKKDSLENFESFYDLQENEEEENC